MGQDDIRQRIDEIGLEPWKPLDPACIEFYYKEELKVNPMKALLDAKQKVTFKAINIDVLVFFPKGVFVSVDEDDVPKEPEAAFFFELKAGEEASFRAIDKHIDLEYSVTSEFYDGLIKSVNRPPVIIIKKVNIAPL